MSNKKIMVLFTILTIILVLIFFVTRFIIKTTDKYEGDIVSEVEDNIVEDYNEESNNLDGVNDGGMPVSNHVVDSSIADENIGKASNDIDGVLMDGPNLDDVFEDPNHEDYNNVINKPDKSEEIELIKAEYLKEINEEEIVNKDIVSTPEEFMDIYLFDDLKANNNKTYPNYKLVDKNGNEKYIKEKKGNKLVIHSMSTCSYCIKTMVGLENYFDSGFNQLDKEDVYVIYHSSSDIDEYNYYNYDFLYKLSEDVNITNADFIGMGVPRWYLLDENNKVIVNGIGLINKTQLRSIDNIVSSK